MNSENKQQLERRRDERRRQIRKLTPAHHCPRCTTLLYQDDESCLDCALPKPNLGWPHLEDSVDPWLGRRIKERYLLTKCIGKGASATVYLAESLGISRQFALKVIHPPRHKRGPTSDQIAARLEREVEALGRLRNPHVVRFYDVVELPLNHIAVVMDFVRGLTMEEVIYQEGQLSVQRAIHLLRQAANGVYEAHLLGMTHRDLKPENLLVELLPAGDEFVHVLDFGIVQIEGEVQVTQGFVGTPLYASPEQALGDSLDFRSDIYSLGALFFFMLTGRPPFMGKTVVEVLKQHVDQPAPTISSLRKDQGVPEAVERLTASMLAKDPKKRPQSLAEVIQQLDAYIAKNSDVSDTLTDAPVTLDIKGNTQLGTGSVHRRESSEFETLKKAVRKPAPRASAIYKSGPYKRPKTEPTEAIAGPRVENTHDSKPNIPKSGIFSRAGRTTPVPNASMPNQTHHSKPSDSLEEESFGQVKFSGIMGRHHVARYKDDLLVFLDKDQVHCWNLHTGREKTYHVSNPERVKAMTLNQETLLIGRDTGDLEAISLADGTQKHLYTSVFNDSVSSVAIDPEGATLWALMESGRIYCSPDQKPMTDWVRVRGGNAGRHIVMCPNGKFLGIVRQGGVVEITRIRDAKNVYASFQIDHEILDISFSNDGYLVAVLTEENTIQIFNVLQGIPIVEISPPEKLLVFFFTQDNTMRGVIATANNTLKVVDLQAVRAI